MLYLLYFYDVICPIVFIYKSLSDPDYDHRSSVFATAQRIEIQQSLRVQNRGGESEMCTQQTMFINYRFKIYSFGVCI